MIKKTNLNRNTYIVACIGISVLISIVMGYNLAEKLISLGKSIGIKELLFFNIFFAFAMGWLGLRFARNTYEDFKKIISVKYGIFMILIIIGVGVGVVYFIFPYPFIKHLF